MVENKKQTILIKNDPYFSGYTRVAIAVLVAVILIWISSGTPFIELIFKKRFYFSLAFGLILAVSIVESIHWVNVLLDKYCNWQQYPKMRLFLQILLGIFGVLYLDLWIVKGIYHILDQNFEESGFIEKILPINAVLILLAHVLFYFRRYDSMRFRPKDWYKKLFVKKIPVDLFADFEIIEEEPQSKIQGGITTAYKPNLLIAGLPQKLLPVPGALKELRYWRIIEGFIQSTKYIFALDEVLCINTGTVYGDIYLKSGRGCNMHYKGKTLKTYLDPAQFIEVRAGVFYALNTIKGVEKIEKRKFLVLKLDFAKIIVNKSISRRYYDQFKMGFKVYQDEAILNGLFNPEP